VSARLDPYPGLDTPTLVLDLDVVERNAREMAAVAVDAGVRLRPHTKTHKSPFIAGIQRAAGGDAITVAKLGEAEVMVDAGFDDVLIAYPIWGRPKLDRLRSLLERASIRVSLDSVDVAEGLGRVGTELGRDVPVLVEVDTGLHRLGRPPGAPTVELLTEIARIQGVDVAGLLTHAGHAYRSTSADELRTAAEAEATDLVETAEACRRAGIELREVSVGSTPTARIAACVDGVTEIRPGTYIFNDVQQMRLGVATEADCAARVLATVVSRPSLERFVIDAGSKAFSSDGDVAPPFPGKGVVAARPNLVLDFFSEEHGVGHVEGGGGLAIGERLEVIPLHVCCCVNLFDVAFGVRGGAVEREIPIVARGNSC
jgi:D-serine deaminase-like pyridoxal phosphate-dependent protein